MKMRISSAKNGFSAIKKPIESEETHGGDTQEWEIHQFFTSQNTGFLTIKTRDLLD